MLSSKASKNQNQFIIIGFKSITSVISVSRVRFYRLFLFLSFSVVLKYIYLFMLGGWYFKKEKKGMTNFYIGPRMILFLFQLALLLLGN